MKTPEELKSGARAERFFQIDAARNVIDQEKRTVELAFSSEEPYERWWGVEILDHNAKSVDLKRLKRGGPLLMDHEHKDQVGVIESVQIDADKVGRALVRFGKSVRANEVFQDVVDGIRTNISVGYQIKEAILESEKDGVGTYRIMSWTPYELSFVSIPADTSVGVGRADDAPDIKTEIILKKEIAMDTPDLATATKSGADVERKRAADILAIGDAYSRFDGVQKLAADAVRGEMTVEQFREKVMEKMASAPKPTAEIGLTDKETRTFSVVRALHALANPADRAAQNAAAFEMECSRAAAEKNGKTPQGMIIPYDVLKRDLVVGTPTAGGNLVATNLLTGSFIDMLRDRMAINGLGTTYLSGLVGNIAIPKQTGSGTSYWLAESGVPTESQQAIGQVAMSPKTVGAFTDISRKLLQQASLDVENMVKGDLATVLALAIQAAAIKGGSTNEPVGILSTAGIGSVAGGVNGLAPTWDHIVDLESGVAVANADVGSLAYLTNAKVRGKLKKTFVDGPGSGERVWDKSNTPLNGYAAGVTNAVPSNLTKGTAAGICSAIIYGNFADLVIGLWGGLDIMVDPYSQSTSGTVRVVELQDVDVALRNALSFSAMLDALT